MNEEQLPEFKLVTDSLMENNDYKIATEHDSKGGKGIYAVAKCVKSYRSVKKIVESVEKWLNANNGKFQPPFAPTAYAIAHNQISDEPYAFFVVHDELVNRLRLKETYSRNSKNFYFPAQTIFNARIVEAPEKVKAQIPKREVTKSPEGVVGSTITRKEGLVSNLIEVPDACMSFPHKKQRNTMRYYKIKVKYQYKCWLGFLWTKTEWVEGLKAHIFQHEIDHAHGINIYYNKK